VQEVEQQSVSADSGSVDEAIVVTRPEEEIDPEEEADFEREYAKMMTDSLEARKLERKPLVDIALPVRAKTKEQSQPTDAIADTPSEQVSGQTMAFALLTKRGNRQQVCAVVEPMLLVRLLHGFNLSSIADTHARAPVRLAIRCRSEESAAGRERRAATHQEPGAQLRSSGERGSRW
jgi:hypothetical protein